MQFTTNHQPDSVATVLQSFLRASGQLFQRRLPDDFEALGVESAMPGLEVSDSTWDDWAATAKQAAARGLAAR